MKKILLNPLLITASLLLLFAGCSKDENPTTPPPPPPQTGDWQVIDLSAISGTLDFSDLFFTDANTGWITSSSQVNIFKTVDGASSFSTQTTPLGATLAINMLDENNGYSGGSGGWVYKTVDGGQNWNILASMGNLLDISFPPNTDPNNPVGYASGDAGRVWEITSTLTDLQWTCIKLQGDQCTVC